MTILYDIIFTIFAIIYLPYLIFTGRYHRDFWQRFGFYPRNIQQELKEKDVIWIHAVSVGEVMAVRALCERMLKIYPGKTLVVSTTTKTGNTVAKRFLKEKALVVYLPLDISLIVNRALDMADLKLFIIVETELWPNLITALHKRGVPVILVNGRISPKSYDSYMKIRFIIEGILRKVALFSMQSEEYASRIKDMGAPAERVAVTGSMKFDIVGAGLKPAPTDIDAIRSDLDLKKDDPVFIAGSTHRPEEEIILNTYRNLLEDFPDLRLLVAPRHIERTQEVEVLIRKYGFTPLRVSKILHLPPSTFHLPPPVLLLDTMGRLSALFAAGTVIFMGGSFRRKGGQNILEPAVFAKPILFGPHMFNFKDIAEAFLREDAACMVKDGDELLRAVRALLKDSRRREELGLRARSLVERSRGATERNMELIEKIVRKEKVKAKK